MKCVSTNEYLIVYRFPSIGKLQDMAYLSEHLPSREGGGHSLTNLVSLTLAARARPDAHRPFEFVLFRFIFFNKLVCATLGG